MITAFLQPFLYYKYLLLQLTQREIKARYKQSFIGYAWVIFNPLAQLLVYTFVFSIVFRASSSNIPYVVFLYAGLLPWGLFQGSISTATMSLVDNAALIRKVSFPREIIPYSIVFSKIIDFLVSSFIFLGMMVAFQMPLHWSAFLVIPLLIVQLFLTSGIALVLAAFNLFYRDIQYLANLLLMLWMYMTPLVYPLSLVPEKFTFVYRLNPMVGFIESYRAFLFGLPVDWQALAWSGAVAFLVFVLGFWLFKRSEKVFADIA